jgi:hypothetical protein
MFILTIFARLQLQPCPPSAIKHPQPPLLPSNTPPFMKGKAWGEALCDGKDGWEHFSLNHLMALLEVKNGGGQ